MTDRAAIHGGDIFAAARELSLGWNDILDFSANMNPLGPPPGLKQYVVRQFGLVENYPDPYCIGWRTELARRYGLGPDEVLAGNGSTALMYLLARALKPKRAVIAVPAFAEYEESLRQTRAKVQHAACLPEDDFDLTPALVDRLFASRPDLVYVANPTSPAGRLIAPDVMDRVLESAERCGARVALDEAFLDFTSAPSMAAAVRRYPHLIVLRSMTKLFALPGLRLGYLTASPPVVEALLAGFEPWSVNALAQAAGLYCMNHRDYIERTRKYVARERDWLSRRLTASGLGRVIPGQANYILAKLERPGLSMPVLAAGLKRRGILVRDCTSFQGLLKGYVRVAVKKRADNRRLIAALRDTLDETTV